MKGLGRMSRMTLLQGEIWLGSGPENGTPRFVRAPEAGYPPYNVELLPEGDGRTSLLRITLAVAGFGVDELAVTVEGGQLIVRGKQSDEQARDYLYRGIAARRFKRSFGLADGVEVRKAELHNGLLAIELERPMKDAEVRTVRIVDSEKAKHGHAQISDAGVSRE
jgi:HSP20 family molecular chaperone IbpA